MSSLILIADDAAEGVEILDAALRRDGFRTVVAADGQQAADLHASLKPDLALLSVRLPVRDGWDVLGELRRRGETPVIMVGDRDEATDKLQALRIGADDYIGKPFKPAEVTASIQTILRRSGGGRAAKTLRVGPLEVQLENYLAAILTPSGKRRLDLTLTEFRILAHMARTPLRVFSRSEIMLRIVLPSALPAIIVGLRIGLGYSWRALVGAGEERGGVHRAADDPLDVGAPRRIVELPGRGAGARGGRTGRLGGALRPSPRDSLRTSRSRGGRLSRRSSLPSATTVHDSNTPSVSCLCQAPICCSGT